MVPKRFDKKLEEKASTLEKQKIRSLESWWASSVAAKQTVDKGKSLANIDMVFILPVEFRAPSRYVLAQKHVDAPRHTASWKDLLDGARLEIRLASTQG